MGPACLERGSSQACAGRGWFPELIACLHNGAQVFHNLARRMVHHMDDKINLRQVSSILADDPTPSDPPHCFSAISIQIWLRDVCGSLACPFRCGRPR